MAETLFSIRGVRAGYGEAVVLDGVSVRIDRGGSLAILGRNGAGKSTLLLTMMGFTTLSGATLIWDDIDISALAPHRRARLGIGWVPQERDIFPSLTVEENLTVAARPGRWDLAAVYDLFPRLAERRRNMGDRLSGGEQQMLTIARTLMTNPRLLLLDEPLEGLAPIIVEELTGVIRRMAADEGMALVLVEQHTDLALTLVRDALVLERGVIVRRAPAHELAADREGLERHVGLQLAEP